MLLYTYSTVTDWLVFWKSHFVAKLTGLDFFIHDARSRFLSVISSTLEGSILVQSLDYYFNNIYRLSIPGMHLFPRPISAGVSLDTS